MVRRRVATSAAALALAAAACGTDATGVDACRQIEEARCRQAPACGVRLEPPYRTSGDDVDACIRFYDTACLHGLEAPDPGTTAVQACVKAIQANGCAVVLSPQSDPACAWLVPPSPAAADGAADSAADAAAGDAQGDGHG